MSVSSLLTAAKAIVSSAGTWTKGANARDADDNPVPILSPDATKWDIFGALAKARVDEDETLANFHGAYAVIRGNIPGARKNQDIESYNDDIAFGAVAAMFDE